MRRTPPETALAAVHDRDDVGVRADLQHVALVGDPGRGAGHAERGVVGQTVLDGGVGHSDRTRGE